MRQTPCFKCVAPKRYPGCGAKCEEYLAWKAKEVAANQARREAEQQRQRLDGVIYGGTGTGKRLVRRKKR